MSWSGKTETKVGELEDYSSTEALPNGWTRFTSNIQIWTGKNWRECDGSRVFRLTHLKLARHLRDRWGGTAFWVNLPDFRGTVETSLGVKDEELLG